MAGVSPMTEFDDLDKTVDRHCATMARLISDLRTVSESGELSKIRTEFTQAERGASAAISEMRDVINSVSTRQRRQLRQKMDRHQNEIDQNRRTFQKNAEIADRKALLGDDASKADREKRRRQGDADASLDRGTARLHETMSLMNSTKELGTATTARLQDQNQSLERANEASEDVIGLTGQARERLLQMLCTGCCNRLLLWIAIGLLFVIDLFVLYWLFLGGDKKKNS